MIVLGANDITRSSPKSSLGCDPGFENPFSIIMQYDKCITRNIVRKQPNIIYNLTNNCTIISNTIITTNMLLHVSTFKMSS